MYLLHLEGYERTWPSLRPGIRSLGRADINWTADTCAGHNNREVNRRKVDKRLI